MEASSSRLYPTYFSVRRLLLGALVILSVMIASCVGASVSGSGGGVSRKVQLKDHRNMEEDGIEIAASNVVQITNENYAKTVSTSLAVECRRYLYLHSASYYLYRSRRAKGYGVFFCSYHLCAAR